MLKIEMEVLLDEALKKTSKANMERSKQVMLNQMLADMNNYVPLRDNGLRSSGHVQGDDLVWATPYAKAQFYGIKKRKGFVTDKQRRWFFWAKKQGFITKGYTTAGTGPHWDKVAEGVHKESWKRVWMTEAGFK